jgi:hypothetical protein
MINLLPQFEKKKLRNEYRLRAAAIVLCGILLIEIVAAASLAPSYYRIDAMGKSLTADLAAKKTQTPLGDDGAQKKIALIQAEVKLLNPSLGPGDKLPSEILEEILEQKPSGIVVNSFSYARSGAAAAAAQLAGVAETREDLLAFQRMLKENSHFGDIKYGQSFITRRTDIDFQLTVTIK